MIILDNAPSLRAIRSVIPPLNFPRLVTQYLKFRNGIQGRQAHPHGIDAPIRY